MNTQQIQLKEEEIKQLEEFMGLTCGDVLFHSDVHKQTKGTSELNQRIVNKNQLLFVIEDTNGNIFGCYLNTKVEQKTIRYWRPTDKRSFVFSLKAKHRDDGKMMTFDIKDTKFGYIGYGKSSNLLIKISSEILLYKQDQKAKSCCYQHKDRVCCHGIENALLQGKDNEVRFTPKRIIVIQMYETEEQKKKREEREKQKKANEALENLKKTEPRKMK